MKKINTTNAAANVEGETIATIADHVKPFHYVIDLSSLEKDKLYQKLTQGLPNCYNMMEMLKILLNL